jgi:hypothetical protein
MDVRFGVSICARGKTISAAGGGLSSRNGMLARQKKRRIDRRAKCIDRKDSNLRDLPSFQKPATSENWTRAARRAGRENPL